MKKIKQIFIKKKSDSRYKLGLTYSGIGYCGLAKDIEIIGTLHEYNFMHDHAILIEKSGRHCAVICKTLKEK